MENKQDLGPLYHSGVTPTHKKGTTCKHFKVCSLVCFISFRPLSRIIWRMNIWTGVRLSRNWWYKVFPTHEWLEKKTNLLSATVTVWTPRFRALHYYLTGTAFQQRTKASYSRFRFSSDVLADKKRLAGVLLGEQYASTYTNTVATLQWQPVLNMTPGPTLVVRKWNKALF